MYWHQSWNRSNKDLLPPLPRQLSATTMEQALPLPEELPENRW